MHSYALTIFRKVFARKEKALYCKKLPNKKDTNWLRSPKTERKHGLCHRINAISNTRDSCYKPNIFTALHVRPPLFESVFFRFLESGSQAETDLTLQPSFCGWLYPATRQIRGCFLSRHTARRIQAPSRTFHYPEKSSPGHR